MGITISGLSPALVPSRTHELPSMKDTGTVKLTVAQILALIEKGDFVSKFNAGDISFTPVGDLASVTVQAALAELDGEKAKVTDLSARLRFDANQTLLPTERIQALANLGVSSFIQAVLDDTTGTAAYDSLGAAESHTTAGYQKLPSGLIIQWGSISCAASASTTQSYPLSFPTSVWSVVLTGLTPTGNTQAYAVLNSAGSLGSFTWSGFLASGGSAPTLAASAGAVQGRFIAIGK